MGQGNSNKATTVILLTLVVVLSLIIVWMVMEDYLNIKVTENGQIIENNNKENNNEKEELSLNSKEVQELITMLGKSEGSLTNSKDIGTGITGVEELMYHVTKEDVSSLDVDIIMYLILYNANITKSEGISSSVDYYGASYEVGYIVEKAEVDNVLYQLFGDNLTTIPLSASEVGVYFIGINGLLSPKYARYNPTTGNIELSLDDVATGGISNYLYLNSYDRVETPSEDILELYEKVIFTNSVFDKEETEGFKIYRDVMCTQYIAEVNNYELTSDGRYIFDEKELNNYINLFAEYKYTFNKDANGKYHLQSIEKIY